MIVHLSIRDLLLIRALDIEIGPGFTALSGETGAGKSIVLTGLTLALGLRAERGLIRSGAVRLMVTARFEIPPSHPAFQILTEAGIETSGDTSLSLRRVIGADERSRAFINDLPVTVGLLRQVGERLCHIHTQFEAMRLLDPGYCRAILDEYAGLGSHLGSCAEAFATWKEAETRLASARLTQSGLEREREYLESALAELDGLAPLPAEEETLGADRHFHMSLGRVSEALSEAAARFSDRNGPLTQCTAIARALERAARIARPEGAEHGPAGVASLPDRLADGIGALERAMLELEHAAGETATCITLAGFDSAVLMHLDNRLFALRAAARKYGAAGEDAWSIRVRIEASLAALAQNDVALAEIETLAAEAAVKYRQQAQKIRALRTRHAPELAEAVMRDLAQMQLGAAQFGIGVTAQDWAEAGPDGADLCEFTLAANPGETGGALRDTASGGELARVALALAAARAGRSGVGTAGQDSPPVLVFDEADHGLGGAQAAAIGALLVRLTAGRQVLAVTHSPQVAASADCHWLARKRVMDAATFTEVHALSGPQRCEEIARMLAGVKLSREARQAAARLLSESRGWDRGNSVRHLRPGEEVIDDPQFAEDLAANEGRATDDGGAVQRLSGDVGIRVGSVRRREKCVAEA